MDGFILYMKKRKPSAFFFFDQFAVFRYGKKTELVDRGNGNLIVELKVGTISEAVFSSKYNKLFLKSLLNGFLYVYDFKTRELRKLIKFSKYDKSIFLSEDERVLIAYTSYGIIQRISVDTLEVTVLNNEMTQFFFKNAWDNPNQKCFEFIYANSNTPMSVLRLDYKGRFISEEILNLNNKKVSLDCIKYCIEKNLYISHYNELNKFSRVIVNVLICNNVNPQNNAYCVLQGEYLGGCSYISIYQNYAFLCYGNKNIYVLDIDNKNILKEYRIEPMTTSAEYDSKRNILFVCTGGGKVYIFEDVL